MLQRRHNALLPAWVSTRTLRALGLGALLATSTAWLSAPEDGEAPPAVQPVPPRPRQPVQPVKLPPDIEKRVQPGTMPGNPNQLGPFLPQDPAGPDRQPAETAPSSPPPTLPGVEPTLVTPEALPLPPADAAPGPIAPGGHTPGTPKFVEPSTGPNVSPEPGVGEPTAPADVTPGNDQPAVFANVSQSTSVKELLAQADRKLDAGSAEDFSDADWQEFTAVIGGTPSTAALADVPEEIYKDYVEAERLLRQAVWNQIFEHTDTAAGLAEQSRERYQRVAQQLPPGDGVYNIVQRVSWGARIRKKYLLNDIVMVPGERVSMSENLNTLNREYRLYLVFKQQDPVKQPHNRVLLIGEIWRNMKEHQAPERALSAVHRSMTQMAEAIFEEDTREENPIGALIPSGTDSVQLLGQRNRLLDQYQTMVNEYELFTKKQRDRLGDLAYVLKLETDARLVFDQRQQEFAQMKAEGRWKEIKALSLTVNGERDKFSRTYAKESWQGFSREVEETLKSQSDTQLAVYAQILKDATEGEKLVELKTNVEKDTQIFGGIDARNWDTLASNVNIKIIEIKQSRGQRFLEGIRTETQNTTTKAGLDQIMEKLSARRNELAALNMIQEYDGVQKDINDRIGRFSQIGQADQQQAFYLKEVAQQKTSNELIALMEKIRNDRTRFAAVLDIPKWDELQQKASLQLDVLLKQEFAQSLTDLEKKAERNRNDLLALDDMINRDLFKAAPEAKKWGLVDRFNKLNDTVINYQRSAQVAGIHAEIDRNNDELVRAKNDHDVGLVVGKFKALEESARTLSIPEGVKNSIRTHRMEAETWREGVKNSRATIESAEAALRDGM